MLLYEGKAKQVYSTESENEFIVYFKDDATAFNGEKKAQISSKGILNNKIDIEKLTDKDIDIIVEFMNQKLYPILLIILERNINGIKGILSNSFIYGRYWYYCKPDIIDFDLFLEKLDY